jgi:hypothetical protein
MLSLELSFLQSLVQPQNDINRATTLLNLTKNYASKQAITENGLHEAIRLMREREAFES